MADAVSPGGSARSSRVSLPTAPDRARRRSSDSPNVLTKPRRSRSQSRLNSPPPSSFALGGRRELVNGVYVAS
jgi:hypothetical protein